MENGVLQGLGFTSWCQRGSGGLNIEFTIGNIRA